MRVAIYELAPDGVQRLVGQLVLRGRRIITEPRDEPLLEYVLRRPILAPGDEAEETWLTAEANPERFLRRLSAAYSGTYLRAGLVECGDDDVRDGTIDNGQFRTRGG